MNNRIKSAIILIDNLLSTQMAGRYNRSSFSDKLEREFLPSTDSSITRVLEFIKFELGIQIEADRFNAVYVIDYDRTIPNYREKYYEYRKLYFRSLLQQSMLDQRLANEYVSFGFNAQNKHVEFLNPFLTAILESKKIRLAYLPFYESKPTQYTVCPIFLKEYLNRWYLITEKLAEERHPIFAIDRIKNYETLSCRFKRTGEVSAEVFSRPLKRLECLDFE